MKKTLFAAALALSVVTPAFAAEEPTPDFTLSGNMGLFSDYRFRGYSQTNFRPAIQGGIDFAHKSGLYLGNWNSNVANSIFNNGNIEMDFYGGYKFGYGDFSFDVGGLYYYYPNAHYSLPSGKSKDYNNFEVYGAVTYSFLTFKYSHGVTDFFGIPNTDNNHYLDLSGTYDLGDGWGVLGHIGLQIVPGLKAAAASSNVTANHTWDFKLGVTKDLGTVVTGLDGWIAGVSLVTTTQRTWTISNNGHPAGRFGAVVSVSKAF